MMQCSKRMAAVRLNRFFAVKRCADLALSALALLVLLPVLVLIGAAVWLTLGPPILFRQRRPGHQGKQFQILKFKTMNDRCDAGGELLPDYQRLSWFGTFLRSTSLDELPELWNVLKGEMSLVGPRPLLVQYLPRYTERQMRRHEVKPGITGWAQVNGRNGLGWEQKFELDIWYVDNQSIWLDMRILCLTLLSVWRREGISQPGHVTMAEFMGSTNGPHD